LNVTLTQEQIASLDNEPQDLRLPETPIGIKLLNIGYDKEALRFERCSEVIPRKCALGHIDRRLRLMCGFKMVCVHCAEIWAKERTEGWKNYLDFMSKAEGKFTYAEVSLGMPRSKEAINAFCATLGQSIPYIHWKHIVGYDGPELLFRLLIEGDHSKEKFAKLFSKVPSFSLRKHHVVPLYRITYFFEKVFLEPWILTDPQEAASQLILLKGMHMLRGPKCTCCGEEFQEDGPGENLVEEDSPTEKSNSNDDKHFHTCQTCRGPLTHIATTSHPPYFNPQQVKWREIPPDGSS